jgi:GNAT superfamily N-acetyltransferase
MTADYESLQGLYKRASLANTGDRTYLLGNPSALVLPEDGVRQGRTRVALGQRGSIIGFSTFFKCGTEIELEDLFVDPPWMRHGVGRELVLDVVSLARAHFFDFLHVTANPHAAPFYDRMGFVIEGAAETQFYPAVRMSRKVGASPAGIRGTSTRETSHRRSVGGSGLPGLGDAQSRAEGEHVVGHDPCPWAWDTGSR